jgi:O-antigen/teichoic acid export membrane protein
VIEADRRGFRAPGTTFMVAGGLIGAVGAYVFQVYGGRALGTDAFAPIAQLWTLFFILATVLLIPVEQYVTREVASGRKAIPGDLVPSMAVAGLGALLGGGFVLFTLDRLFAGSWDYVVQIVLLMIGYGFLFIGKGVLAGRRRFADVGWVLVIETVARLIAGVIALQLIATAESLGWAMVLGGFSVLGLRWWRHDVGEARPPVARAPQFLGGYVGGTASSQVLLGAAPIAVALLGGSEALQSVVFATFTLYRAPLTLIFALQGRILPFLVGLAGETDRARLSRIAKMVVAGGVVLSALGGLVGWLVGPEVVSSLFKPEFAPSATVAALAAAGVVAAATAQIAGQVLVAEARTSRMAIAWVGGLLTALVVLLVLGGQPDVRVALAFAIGEGVALILMAVLAIRR